MTLANNDICGSRDHGSQGRGIDASMTRLVLLVALSALLSGCIPIPATRVPAGLDASATQPAGVVFGSIGHGSKYDFNSQQIFFRQVGSSATGSFTYTRGVTVTVPIDIEQGEKKATLFTA